MINTKSGIKEGSYVEYDVNGETRKGRVVTLSYGRDGSIMAIIEGLMDEYETRLARIDDRMVLPIILPRPMAAGGPAAAIAGILRSISKL